MIDTHTHLYLPEFESPSAAVDRALEAGVAKMVMPNVGLDTVEPMMKLRCRYPQQTHLAMGLHPTEIKQGWHNDLSYIKSVIDANDAGWCAIGEIGMDLYWDTTFRTQQMDALGEQLEWACDLNLPVIIHCRNALEETLHVIGLINRPLRGVFHSFGGSVIDVEAISQAGQFLFGINGIVTFKNSSLRSVLPAIGLDRILLETDSPYLAPVPFRGRRNESAYVVKVAEAVASGLEKPLQEVESVTDANATGLFNLNPIAAKTD